MLVLSFHYCSQQSQLLVWEGAPAYYTLEIIHNYHDDFNGTSLSTTWLISFTAGWNCYKNYYRSPVHTICCTLFVVWCLGLMNAVVPLNSMSAVLLPFFIGCRSSFVSVLPPSLLFFFLVSLTGLVSSFLTSEGTLGMWGSDIDP